MFQKLLPENSCKNVPDCANEGHDRYVNNRNRRNSQQSKAETERMPIPGNFLLALEAHNNTLKIIIMSQISIGKIEIQFRNDLFAEPPVFFHAPF